MDLTLKFDVWTPRPSPYNSDRMFISTLPMEMSTRVFHALDHSMAILRGVGGTEYFLAEPRAIEDILGTLKAAKVDLRRVEHMDINRGAVKEVVPRRSFWRRKPSAAKSVILFNDGDKMNINIPQARVAAALAL